MIYKCENQYKEASEKYERCFLNGQVCIFALHNTQNMCGNARPDKINDLELKAEGQLFVGSRI